MRRLARLLGCSVLGCSLLSGCAFNSLFINYPSQLAPVRQSLASNNPAEHLKDLGDNIHGNDGLLYAQEAGRVAQVSGDFAASQGFYASAIAAYEAFDAKATLSASELGANAGALVLNDNVIPYRGPGFERILVHQYQALNFLMQRQLDGALVEVRRANELQALEQARYEKSSAEVRAMANGTVNAEQARLGQAAGSVSSSFLNAYSYYTTGLLHELLGNSNDAFIDYRKAALITPGNPYLEQDLLRLARELEMPQREEFERQFGQAEMPQPGQGQLVLMLERGLVPEKQALTVPFTINGNWQSVSLATYPGSPLPLPEVQVTGLGEPLTMAPLAEIDALAINALKENLPLMLLRQAARVVTKAEMASSIQSERKKADGSFDGGVIAMQIFNLVTEQADRRSWLTLPRQALLARRFVNPGDYSLALANHPGQSVSIEAGKTTLVWAVETGNLLRFYSIIL
ncbi:COG3014 family protein [Shewanella sedimentimangrovi]|uniref:Tetratricopeptide TPR_2 repeat protein n=1 Tax=Shewanella sedimentimangrovi TaxID=2814293 RepID=A0ABX7R4Y2_9GAMM|nr:hypothetical protein [Shewanella sedimentimangrovi]QSX37865.1 hypothetical protein JYB85_03215 [Shewanella sedimentimangrovi]